MSDAPPPISHDGRPPPSPRRALAVLALMLALAAGGWFLVQRLSDDSSIQDCVMAGRHNCAPVDPQAP